jgi:hypothetical protein
MLEPKKSLEAPFGFFLFFWGFGMFFGARGEGYVGSTGIWQECLVVAVILGIAATAVLGAAALAFLADAHLSVI